MAKNSSGGVSTLCRFLFVLSVGVYVGVIALTLVTQRLSNCDRTLFAVLGSFPAVAFIMALILYQDESRVLDLSSIFFIRTVCLTVVLLLPAGFLVVRNMLPGLIGWGKWGFVSSLIFVVLVPLPRLGKNFSPQRAWELLAIQYFQIMWNPTRIGYDLIDDYVLADRRPQYTEEESLSIFQKTWTGRVSEAKAASELLANRLLGDDGPDMPRGKIQRVLDVGCAEGTFTAVLLKNLRKAKLLTGSVEVLGIDPINWEREFCSRLNQIEGVAATFRVGRLGNAERVNASESPRQFDLVIASHSLYGICDKAATGAARDSITVEKVPGLEDVTRRLRELAGELGSVLLVLSSKRSVSYEFKRRALREIYKKDIEDLAAESLGFLPSMAQAGREMVDGVMEMESLLGPYEDVGSNRSLQETLVAWLRYFLRAPLRRGEFPTDRVRSLLDEFLVRRANLPEDLRKASLSAGPFAACDDDRVLLHKTEVVLY